MTNVIVNGQQYVPMDSQTSGNIGIAITTHNRPEDLKQSLEAFDKYTPSSCLKFLIIADGKQTYDYAVEQAEGRQYVTDVILSPEIGVATAKNTCLYNLLYNEDYTASNVQHLFLFDDDTYPKTADWYQPYIDGAEPHYAHSFNLQETYRDDNIVATYAVGGSMLYYTRQLIEQVGGMRTDFGTWGCEHVNLSDRIHNLEYTTFRYQDIPEAYDGNLFTELDRGTTKATNPNHKSSATPEQIAHNKTEAYQLWQNHIRTDIARIPLHQPNNLILTCLYTNVIDPQRNINTGLTLQNMRGLTNSVDTQIILMTDNQQIIESHPTNITPILCKPSIRADYQRWIDYHQYLQTHPAITNAWCVDATDVTMLNSPWHHMQPNTLYIGDEPDTLQSEWLHNQGKDTNFLKFINTHPTLPLLNTGLVGGDRKTLLAYTQHMSQAYNDDQIDNIQTWETNLLGTDMAAANQTAYNGQQNGKWTLIHGPQVNQTFRTNIGTEHAWWSHKLPA